MVLDGSWNTSRRIPPSSVVSFLFAIAIFLLAAEDLKEDIRSNAWLRVGNRPGPLGSQPAKVAALRFRSFTSQRDLVPKHAKAVCRVGHCWSAGAEVVCLRAAPRRRRVWGRAVAPVITAI